MLSRKSFLAALSALFVVPFVPRAARGEACTSPKCSGCKHHHPHAVGEGHLNHPDPREGITAERVIPADEIRAQGFDEEIVALWAGIAEIPELADGIACYCGCMLPPMNKRSLLSCYEVDGMARGCEICQGTARLVIRRHGEGQSIDRIRAAVDARYAM